MNRQEWNEIYRGYVNDTQDSLAKQAKNYLNEIYDDLVNITGDTDLTSEFIVSLFALLVDADGVISNEEWELFNYIFGTDYTDYSTLRKTIDGAKMSTNIDSLDNVIDSCSKDLKAKMIKFCLCVCAIDENITISEQIIIEKFAD